MSYGLEFMDTALQDAAEIRDYLKQFYSSTVHKFVDALDNSTLMLQDNPYIGTSYREYRKLTVGVYLVFYKVDENEKLVRIYRILHGARDLEADGFAMD